MRLSGWKNVENFMSFDFSQNKAFLLQKREKISSDNFRTFHIKKVGSWAMGVMGSFWV